MEIIKFLVKCALLRNLPPNKRQELVGKPSHLREYSKRLLDMNIETILDKMIDG